MIPVPEVVLDLDRLVDHAAEANPKAGANPGLRAKTTRLPDLVVVL